MHSGAAIQEAVYSALVNAAGLTADLGGPFVHDDVPDRQKPPYVVIGKTVHSDWSTGTEAGAEHSITLDIWSRKNGRKQVFSIADQIATAMQTLQPSLTGHHLVNLQLERLEISQDPNNGYYHGMQTFRAVTEPI